MGDAERRHVPWLTLALVGLGVAALHPVLASLLEHDAARFWFGEWWRPFTGQLTSRGLPMAAADLGAVLLLGTILESRAPALARRTLVAGGVAVAGVILLREPALATYRGASGLASALIVGAALEVGFGSRTAAARGLAALALVGFGAKLTIETLAGHSAFGAIVPEGPVILTSVHVAGALAAALVRLADHTAGAAASHAEGPASRSPPSGSWRLESRT